MGGDVVAGHRMFSVTFTESDRFVEMSLHAKALYLFLVLRADDAGFISSARSACRQNEIPDDAIEELVDRGYLLRFDGSVYLIAHWLEHNKVEPSKYTETNYKNELSQLDVEYEEKEVGGKIKKRVFPREGRVYRFLEDREKVSRTSLEKGYVGYDRVGNDRVGEVNSSSTSFAHFGVLGGLGESEGEGNLSKKSNANQNELKTEQSVTTYPCPECGGELDDKRNGVFHCAPCNRGYLIDETGSTQPVSGKKKSTQ
jgi:hypothetical protein